MVPSNLDKSQLTRKVVSSEAWPERLRSQYCVASVHDIFADAENTQIEDKDISFKLVGSDHIEEIKKLHQEWFPIYYNDAYFSKLNNNKDTLCMGAFYKDKYLVGIFIGMFKYNSMILKELTKRSWFSCHNICGLYIATIGVVDEVRRLGIGSKLVENVIEWTKVHKTQ